MSKRGGVTIHSPGAGRCRVIGPFGKLTGGAGAEIREERHLSHPYGCSAGSSGKQVGEK